MFRIEEAKVMDNYRIWVKYADGTEGTVDLSRFVGKGVFAIWENYNVFRQVSIGTSGELVWNDEVDICPDTLYMEITGKSAAELFEAANRTCTNA